MSLLSTLSTTSRPVMPDRDRESFIPVKKGELIELLCAAETVSAPEADAFRHFCRLVTDLCHFEYHRRLEKLKTAYAPFDPDADTRPLGPLAAEERLRRMNDLFQDFSFLMEHAQYKHLTREEIEPALYGASAWGVRMDVDFRVFERLAIFSRGDTLQKRVKRRLRSLGRVREIDVPVYQRLVMIMKLRPHERIGKGVDTDCVYFQIFKNIPKLDIKMLLPGARVRFSLWDRGKMSVTMGSGLGLALWNTLQTSFETLLGLSPLAFFGLVSGTLGYGVKSYWAFQHARQRLHLNLTRVLFYQNLDTNAGVLFRLLDEAEEQECREAILAYFFLWKHAGEQGWTGQELHEQVERYLERFADLRVEFEIAPALAVLERLHLLRKAGERNQAVPLDEAVKMIGAEWSRQLGIGLAYRAGVG